MDEKILTILVPAYNLARSLEKTVKSILRAAHKEKIELLIVDDGSTDETFYIATQMAKENPSIVRCFRKDNGHYGSVLNYAIKKAAGTYFKIIDGGDSVDSQGLDRLILFLLDAQGYDMIVTCYEICFIKKNRSSKVEPCLPEKTSYSFSDLMKSPYSMHMLTFKTSILANMRREMLEGVPYTDVEYMLYPTPFVNAIGYCPTVVYRYELGVDDQTMDWTKFGSNLEAHWMVMSRLASWSKEQLGGLEEEKIRYIAKRIGEMACSHIDYCLFCGNHEESELRIQQLLKLVKDNQLISDYFNSFPARYVSLLDGRGLMLLKIIKMAKYRYRIG